MSDYRRWQKSSLEEALASRRVVMLTGPCQCGKTTLARKLVSNKIAYRTLDDMAARQAAETDPHLFVDYAPKGERSLLMKSGKYPTCFPLSKR